LQLQERETRRLKLVVTEVHFINLIRGRNKNKEQKWAWDKSAYKHQRTTIHPPKKNQTLDVKKQILNSHQLIQKYFEVSDY
tara:strand:- start:1766 stop:2008 length:243 start_codon:yes stop_codon:yes gene_type:complete